MASDLTITSHRGGLNEDPPHALRDDELIEAMNIEFWQSMLGARRYGCSVPDLTSSGLTAKDQVCFLAQWYPTNVPTLTEWLAAAVTLSSSIVFARRDTGGTWHAVTASDTVETAAPYPFFMRALGFNGHAHWLYKSNQDRSHILKTDGTMRRSGLAAPGAPTAADTGTAGTFSGARYYRVRVVEVSGTTVLRRSEPGSTLTFTPSKTKNGVTVTQPASLPGEGETHWELEASLDNENFYMVSRIILATTTYTDTTSGPKTYPTALISAPASTDGTGVTYVLLSNQAAQLALTGNVPMGQYSDGTNIAGRGWYGYDNPGTNNPTGYIPFTNITGWSRTQNWWASPDVAAEVERQVSTGNGGDYADIGTVSEAIGAYLTLPSFKYAIVDGDRLVYASHQSDASLFSQVGWTPPTSDPGVGNDERAPIVTTGGTDITSKKQLDNYAGGGLTGLAPGILGTWFAFKFQRIYGAQRTHDATDAYDIDCITTSRGAIDGSVIVANDARGNTVIYFLDPFVGPCQLTPGGVVKAIRGLSDTWVRVNTKATNVVACGCFYPKKGQVIWSLSVDGGNSPSLGIVLDTNYLRDDDEGYLRGGITQFDGKKAAAFCMAALTYTSGNETTDIPFVGVSSANGSLLRTDDSSVYKDNGTSFTARLRGKPRYTAGLLRMWGALKTAALFTAQAAGFARVGIVRDQGASPDATCMGKNASLAPLRTEPQVLVVMNDVNVSEASSVQVLVTDGEAADADKPWSCQRIDLNPSLEGDA